MEPPPQRLAVFVVAHPDDWQLFMGNVAVRAAAHNVPVLFVYVTAGGADRPQQYWRAREAGSLASAYAAVAANGDSVAEPPPSRCSEPVIRDHRIARCEYRNSVSYFLRLPDGAFDGGGFAQTGHRSLRRFETGEDSSLTAVDDVTSYRNWSDLRDTVAALVERERTIFQVGRIELNTHDPDEAVNPRDHSDHQAVGRLVSEIGRSRGLATTFYAGYVTSQMPPNLSLADLSNKLLAFMVYDRERILSNREWSAYAEDPSAYSAWLYRTYSRRDAETAR